MKRITYIILMGATAMSCAIQNKNVTNYKDAFESNWSDGDITYLPNESNTYILATRKSNDSRPSINYTVYEIATNKELYKSAFIGSSIEWLNDEEVVIKGTSRLENAPNVIINVLSGKSRKESRLK